MSHTQNVPKANTLINIEDDEAEVEYDDDDDDGDCRNNKRKVVLPRD